MSTGVLAWGRQLDVRVVRDGHRTDDRAGPLTPEQVAGYLAKYATKDANSIRSTSAPRPHLTGSPGPAVTSRARARDHDQAVAVRAAGQVGAHARFPRPLLVQVRAATRSPSERCAALDTGSSNSPPRPDVPVSPWTPATSRNGSWPTTRKPRSSSGRGPTRSTGWTRPGDEALALAAAARAREYDQWRAKQRRSR